MIGTKTPLTQSTASLSSAGSDGSGADIVFDSHDERLFVKDLLEEHSSDIGTVRAAIQTHPLYDSSRYDDIWILRFVLSHKNDVDAASRAAMATMEFREAHNLNEKDLRGKIKHLDGVPSSEYGLPHSEKVEHCAEKYAALVTLPDEHRGPIMYIYLSHLHMNKINETMTQEDLKHYTIYINEAVYQVLDSITRKTGRLTKLLKIVDIDGITLKKMNRGHISKDAAASKELDDYFPQLLGGMFIVNQPRLFNLIWKFARPLMPKRVVEKIDFLPPNTEKVQKSLARFVSEENLLERYGGGNKEWPPLCVGSYFR
mmetsp:Transcript_30733/g.56958  ORF Transcript_30733/g.56958 Transcript_30733/m.56958 type:complete len:314 (-) Transcript_30733:97-1038(-)|eukprot:CAMPEP_0201884856 /NCGR_PEP_ID=MMETSP0902-20130614/17590_1 /ASSEMBLY_ACC=CAM_ASM_000551 /TAXON_ID=420261 /ORGANISM="Thalassiosira antarctica, Strain CCMP982" /LENGTH=313 /DNA_ID=CAMNT_0048413871 /DNA_START=80 /DNA_END=1021 /DNA_ORIENTATION=+